mmetsp:Transcript_26399/g.88439  ORF Transcript_26399/g.88439 Transcript_26399/m.88439 type:complete len:258 (+) Transcript_26399:99-872(+)|eukprot:CAMPEP_0205999548 /NCGR_PEP_ID=MMETSP1464-20131121/916_1 /ASSEMBLY_ACC=CAM_ASM_001124 /TAXON_ID=119497 /ORGANISM="Exanthemachrysis gayraliae, Strain RCC1523" /LENGTH=257 /DNA_ID=CAMNT_0053372755 /DNA_START=57 /DNA_END=830 /DNA_ORIENTATION=-
MEAEDFSRREWQDFEDVKSAMADEERELSTDEDEVEPVERQTLLDAAAERLARDARAAPQPTANPGRTSAHFDDRMQSVFGGIGNSTVGNGVQLRFWTSLHSVRAAAINASDEPQGTASRDAVKWNPFDDLLSLSEPSDDEDDGRGGDGIGDKGTAKRIRDVDEGSDPGAKEGPGQASRRRVRFGGAEIVEIDASRGRDKDGRLERPGYTRYSFDDDDDDGAQGMNRSALMDALRMSRATSMPPVTAVPQAGIEDGL